MRRAALVAVAWSVVAGGVAGAETRPRYGGTIEATLLGAPATLDPAEARTHAEITVAGLLFDTLYRLEPDGAVVPHLAAGEPTYDEKRTTAFIPIRKRVRMHDGSDLTPADVAASIVRERASARWLLVGLIAAKADGDGVVLSLRTPLPDLTAQLAAPQLGITRAGRAGERPVGSGPYAIAPTTGPDPVDRGRKKLTLQAFDDHFAGRPYVDALVLTWYDKPDSEARRFETGKSHVSARGATAFSGGRPTFRTDSVEGPPALLVYVGLGAAHRDVLADRAFRRALDLALARGGLIAITSGEHVVPTRGALPVEAGGLALDTKGRASDISAARDALTDAQRRVPALADARLDALRLEILVEETRPDDREIAERVVLALDKLGIGAVITALPAPALRDRVTKGTYDLTIGQLAEPLASPSLWLGAAFQAGRDDFLQPQLSAGTVDPVAASKEFGSRLPIIPLMFRSVRMWHPTNVHGLELDVFGRPDYANLSLFGAPTRNQGRSSR